jgi:transposase
MTFFLGCDVAKDKIDVALVDGTSRLLWQDRVVNEPFVLAEYLLTIQGGYTEDITAIVEPTGRYHMSLLDAAVAVNFNVRVMNPILTKQGIKASIRGQKTDKTDAVLIARMGVRGEGRTYTPEPYMDTKLRVRSYEKLVSLKVGLKQHRDHCLAMDEVAMTKEVKAVFQTVEDAITQAQADLLRNTLAAAQGELLTHLQTIPGIGPFVALCLIGEIQDMTRFKKQKQLIAYFGLDPRIRQSGHTLNSTGRLTKRGSPHGRRAIFIAANVAKRFDPSCRAYYQKKRNEGKSFKVANIAVARRLLLVVRAVWLSNGTYDSTLWEA